LNLCVQENFGKQLGKEIPGLLSDVANIEYDKLLENQKLFEGTLEKIFREGAGELKDVINNNHRNDSKNDNMAKGFLNELEESQDQQIISLFFQKESFRDKLLEEYLLDSKRQNIASAFFGHAKPPVETTSSKTYEQVMSNGMILLNKVQENLSEADTKNTTNKCTRIACQETSIFKEKGMFSQYLEMLKGINQTKEKYAVLFCFKENTLNESEIIEILRLSHMVISDELGTVFDRSEKR
jgi:hypothetical protein